MKTGKVPESVLKRSVIKQVKVNRDKILSGPGVGMDVGALVLKEGEAAVMSTAPVSGTAKDIGVYGLMAASNNLAAAGADPIGIMLTILLPPKTEEAVLRELVKNVADKAKACGMAILGGHTETMEAVLEPVISITAVGKVKKDKMLSAAGARPGHEIIMTKYAGLAGTAKLACEKEKELMTRYPLSFIREAQDLLTMYSVTREAEVAREFDVAAMHDIAECGLFGALWELAAASKVGLEIELSKVPIRQQTVEVCEFYDLNPYMLRSGGSLLIVAERGSDIVDALHDAGIEAAVIGRMREDNDKIVIYGEDRETRFLEPPRRDEIYKVL
ncbi:MAG: hydrogenase maturation factor [Lachnospiraceae bacterium]|nr:hydrogenase maturation factor [Lachnospiraceae bacterium]